MKKIALTMGEPGGIGPEIILKTIASDRMKDLCLPVVIGDAHVMEDAANMCGIPLRVRSISGVHEARAADDCLQVIHVETGGGFEKGVPSASAGKAVVEYIKVAVNYALQNEVEAIVTAPLSKTSLHMARCPWPGHTELLAELTESAEFAMMFVSDKLRIVLCTIHISLSEVSQALNEGLVFRTIRLAGMGADMLGMKRARIAVAGLNPHAGEGGLMGPEETRFISPAVLKAREEGMQVTGPLPPDVVFHRAYKGEFDMIVCMYHDQGLIPFKMLAFEEGVNVTVGLPIIRTSPDHGTAFDIAWQNRADARSMLAAVKLAAGLRLPDRDQKNPQG